MSADLLDADSVRNWLREQGKPELAELLPTNLPGGLSIGKTVQKISDDAQVFQLIAMMMRNSAQAHTAQAQQCLELAKELERRCQPSS